MATPKRTKTVDDDVAEPDELLRLRREVAQLRHTNEQLTATLKRRDGYIRDKVNQLLDVMGTKPLREEELDDNSIQDFDPLGIIFESFRHILASLKDKNNQLQILHDEMVAIFAAAQVGIMVVDQDQRIISCNKRMQETFFPDLAEGWANTACHDLICKGKVPDRLCAVHKILKGVTVASFKGWETNGRTFDVEAAPIHDNAGAVNKVVLVYNDITDLKKTQTDLRQLNDKLEQLVEERTALYQEANKELETFCYSVSHDLRAPLRHINGFTNILREDYSDRLDQEAGDILQRICTVSERMGSMIDDLLGLARVTRSATTLRAVDLTQLAESAAAMFREADQERRVRFCIEQGLTAWGDAPLLGIVMQNLIGNAWKYSAMTSEAVIEVGKQLIDGSETFYVRDNGIGFDMAYRDKLFRVFERLHGDEFEGSGIGLATVQRIISRHKGRIWAEGAVGKGATFFFTLQREEVPLEESK